MNMLKLYNFRMPRNILFGIDAASHVGEKAKELNGTKALIVTDKALHQTGNVEKVKKYLVDVGIGVDIYDEVVTEPITAYVEQGEEKLKAGNCDLIVALGGGSCIDTAKAIAMLGTNPGPLKNYEGMGKMKNPKVPMIAMPTTAGTGSEVTWVFVVTDLDRNVKSVVYSPYLIPEEVIEDPLLTVSCPPGVTLASGMDALVHAVEGYVATRDPNRGYGSPPLISFFALPAIKLVYENIRTAWADGENIEARSNMLLGQLMAGMTFGNNGTGLVHSIAHEIGVKFHIAHGLSNAILFPHCVEYSSIAAPKQFAEMAGAMGEPVDGLSLMDAADKASIAIKRLCQDLRVPRLRDLEITETELEDAIPDMVEEVMRGPLAFINARKPTREDVIEIIHKCF